MPELVLNRGTKEKVLGTLKRKIEKCESFKFYVAFVNKEGVQCLKQQLIDAEISGKKGQILVSGYLNFTDPAALADLLRFKNIELRILMHGNHHAKGYFFKSALGNEQLIGSSNWTASALTQNTELNILINESESIAYQKDIECEFTKQFNAATPVTFDFLKTYRQSFEPRYFQKKSNILEPKLRPNKMQEEVLESLLQLRARGQKKGLLVSATGTGKTYLSAFDAKSLNAKRLLFVVHRETIARKALESFRDIFGTDRTYGLYTGGSYDQSKDFIFSTIQTLSRSKHLMNFSRDNFEYIVIDESHRTGSSSYDNLLNYFTATKFLLGMTATPERTDGADIFAHFDHNIAAEIRLHQALEAKMLCPFHYFGIADSTDSSEHVDAPDVYSTLNIRRRANELLNASILYGSCDEMTKGLIFCSRNEEAKAIADELNQLNCPTVALSGSNSTEERERAIRSLEANDQDSLRFIITVDIFNEGVDIPSVNQVIMCRPTESAIIFVQQLGRGLRLTNNPDKYLTVIDFIGNYTRNFLIPVALYGDRSFDKDQLRRLVSEGDAPLPGSSTVSFDRIAKERIFESISNPKNLFSKKELIADYDALKVRLGRSPMMMDFIKYGQRDARQFGKSVKGSYLDFVKSADSEFGKKASEGNANYLREVVQEALNGSAIEEALLLQEMLKEDVVDLTNLVQQVPCSLRRLIAAINNLNLQFYRKLFEGKRVSSGDRLGETWFKIEGETLTGLSAWEEFKSDLVARSYLEDEVSYCIELFRRDLDPDDWDDSFVYGRKYSRADVFQLLNYDENPVAQNVGGYLINQEQQTCPIFVTYHKEDNISDSTKYEDHFLNPSTMHWFSKSKRTLSSPDVNFLRFCGQSNEGDVRLFVKKNDDEGTKFYYLGKVKPIPESFLQDSMATESGPVSVVRMDLELQRAVPANLYSYLTD